MHFKNYKHIITVYLFKECLITKWCMRPGVLSSINSMSNLMLIRVFFFKVRVNKRDDQWIIAWKWGVKGKIVKNRKLIKFTKSNEWFYGRRRKKCRLVRWKKNCSWSKEKEISSKLSFKSSKEKLLSLKISIRHFKVK